MFNNRNITVNGVLDIPTPASSLPEDADDPVSVGQALVDNAHRISDVAVGIIGNGIVEPVTASGETQPAGGTGVCIITQFDGSDFLQDEDITIQSHLYSSLAGGTNLDLYWDNAVSSYYKRNGLWLPPFGESTGADGNFSGLVPSPWTGGGSDTMNWPGSGNLYDYDWLATDLRIVNDTELEFLFHFTLQDLYAPRCIDETASDWFRKIRPWSFKIRDIVTQAGDIYFIRYVGPGGIDQIRKVLVVK